MDEKDDWRFIENGEDLRGARLKKIKFPSFWKKAYAEKNDFYRLIKSDAENFVKEYRRGEEFLKGEEVRKFWHEHCEFCFDKITTDDDAVCYCTPDYKEWVCKKCFDDFADRFGFSSEE